MLPPHCSRQNCNPYQSTSFPTMSMYAARQPMQDLALMHGSTPVCARQFNHPYNDSAKGPHFSSFTTRPSHSVPQSNDTPGQSHALISRNGQFHPPIHHNEQTCKQPVSNSAKKHMSRNQSSLFSTSDASLDGSLLCSPYPPLPTLRVSPHFTTAPLLDGFGRPYYIPAQTTKVPEPDVTFPALERPFSSSCTSLTDPTPGLTPISSLESTPATSVGEDGNLAWSSHKVSPQTLEGFRQIQPKPPDLPPPVWGTNDFPTATDDAPGSVPNATGTGSLEWPFNTSPDSDNNKFAQGPRFQDSDFGMSTFDGHGYDTIDPAALDAFNNFVDMGDFESAHNELPGIYPEIPDEFNPFPTLKHSDSSSAVDQSFSSDPFMPLIDFQNDVMAMPAFDYGSHTGNLGPGELISLPESTLHTTPTATSTVNGEGSRRDTTRDEDLVKLRARGLSYRDIKMYHGFDVAESTLRGRMRSLMKKKEERVRKPTWKPDNIRLLCNCVMEFAIQNHFSCDVISNEGLPLLKSEQSVSKISWKKVAKAMADRGSYHYGNATVKKKYMELRKEQMTRRS